MRSKWDTGFSKKKRRYLAADEAELRKLTDSAISKLKGIGDFDYAGLDLFPELE